MIESLEATITAVSFLSLNLTLKLCVFHRVSKRSLEAGSKRSLEGAYRLQALLGGVYRPISIHSLTRERPEPRNVPEPYTRRTFYKSLYFNRFRGELAISEFDWPFTPFHKSSQSLATDTSEVLMTLLKAFQPVHEKITQFRV